MRTVEHVAAILFILALCMIALLATTQAFEVWLRREQERERREKDASSDER